MAWILLFIAGLLEVVWAFAMKQSHGFTRLWPSVATLAFMGVSFALLSLAMKSLPMGTAYVIWTGIGAVGAFAVGVVLMGESLTPLRVLAALLVEAWRCLPIKVERPEWRRAIPLLFIGVLLIGAQALRSIAWTTTTGEPISVALLQGNVPQDVKWRPEAFGESLRTYYQLALDNPAQLTVLPETALPAFLANVPGEYLDALEGNETVCEEAQAVLVELLPNEEVWNLNSGFKAVA